MTFPKFLSVLLHSHLVLNVSKTGEVTNGWSEDLPMIELLSKELGFSYTIYSAAYRYYGDFRVGNYILDERSLNKSTYPFAVTDYTFATVKSGYSSNSLASLKPFTMPVWTMLLLSIVLMTFAKFFIFWRKVPLMSVLFYASVALLGKDRDWKPKSNAQKLLVLIWRVGMTFLTLAYGAVILSFLTVPVREKGITNFQELYDAMIKGKASALKFEGSSIEKTFITSGSEKLKFIGEQIQKQKAVSGGYGGNIHDVMKRNVVVISSRAMLEAQYGGDGYFIAADSVFSTMRVMYEGTENGFCCMKEVNAVIHRIWGAGLLSKLYDDEVFRVMLYLRSILPNAYSRVENTLQPLSLSDMSGVFYLLLTGHVLAVISLLCEIVSHGYFCRIRKIPSFRPKMYRKRD